jgi:integrative and conjugative element protein (TIGR02256 family)
MTSPVVQVVPGVLERMQDALLAALPRETGGILVGWRDGTDVVVIDALSVPDEGAQTMHYTRHHDKATRVLDRYLADATDPMIGYVGEWHTHPWPSPPSRTDRTSVAAAASRTDAAVALIVLAWDANQSDADVHTAIVHRRSGQLVLVPATCTIKEGAKYRDSVS